MSAATPPSDHEHWEQLGDLASGRLRENQRVSRSLPEGGRLVVDRPLPFLFVYRMPSGGRDAGTEQLLASEASYLIAPSDPQYHRGIVSLCKRLESAMQDVQGRFLQLELWAARVNSSGLSDEEPLPLLQPVFSVVCTPGDEDSEPVAALVQALTQVTISGRQSLVKVTPQQRVAPAGLEPISAGPGEARTVLGLEVRPIYRDSATQTVFPIVLHRLRSELATALRKTVAQFARPATPEAAPHFQSYGSRTLVKSLRSVDQRLCAVGESFDFLLQATPTNSVKAWAQFAEGGYAQEPAFAYRPLPYDPITLKRALFSVEADSVADPTLSHLFREKQVELDRQISALRDLNTPAFRYACLQLYGEVDDALAALAHELLDHVDPAEGAAAGGGDLSLDEVVKRAQQEIAYYRKRLPEFEASVSTDADIPSGVMVTRGTLLISENARITPRRIDALLHHEVGTHLLTYFNGRRQPLRLLSVGLAGYEELQEGIAVLLEHLSGGLTSSRVRVLAGRVVAVRMMSDGRPFTETFTRLHKRHGFAPRSAFLMTLRVYRGGGMTKDAIYLRGLRDLLEFLANEGDLEPLLVGKVALAHLRHLEELQRRGIVTPPAVLPRLWDLPELRQRLDACRGRSVRELLEMDR
ncbi:hypothetical protein Pla175_30710 [Pirellulimonas nuda]|uniref:Flavohemoglobin expression-modulating QEGLA motif protein n=1 Tax=Pirellulimonas nuda TaxID=2528009 RepID=A0A518DDY4_9BACT|nr:flavohemoglobin expression-modulating QEGLA motif protein [Pirellulimonas nuda]QDU89677.1 hypothetical protein Pla175_30710 [Pirellulimonas nuda]